MQAGIRLGGGLGWAQREAQRGWEHILLSCPLTDTTLGERVCVAAGRIEEVRVGHKQPRSDTFYSTWAWSPVTINQRNQDKQ